MQNTGSRAWRNAWLGFTDQSPRPLKNAFPASSRQAREYLVSARGFWPRPLRRSNRNAAGEPWSWACYHYGSWVSEPTYGWVWVPGVEWSPAWVSWRIGGDYIGWAPCGPSGYVVEPSVYVFVQSGHFNDRVRPEHVIVNNPEILRSTTAINNIRREQRQFEGKSQTVVFNAGPRVDTVEKATGHKFTAVSVQEADRHTLGSIPKTLKQRPAQTVPAEKSPAITPQPIPAPEHRLTPGGNPELPNNPSPKKELPAEKMVPSERIIPPTPPERVVPPAERELPRNIEPQHPKATVPPVQPVRPPTPNQGANQEKTTGNGQEKDKEH